MKECDYCGRENEDDAVYCRECGTERFKNDPPPVRTRISAGEFIKNCAASLDELASSREMLVSWVAAAWIVQVWLHMVGQNYGQAIAYVGLRAQWWQDGASRWVIGGTFILAPFIGGYCIVRWLRKKQGTLILNLFAWMLLAFFVGVFCLLWIAFWDTNPGEWFDYLRGY